MRVFRTRLTDSRWQNWNTHVQESERFDIYRQINPHHCVPGYITANMDSHLKHIVTRFRLGISEINIHQLRYKQFTNRRLICPMCKNAQETECHFVLCCPAFDTLRKDLLPKKFYRQPSLFKLVLLMSSTQEEVVKRFPIFFGIKQSS